jgi:hypothetical protein
MPQPTDIESSDPRNSRQRLMIYALEAGPAAAPKSGP